MAGPAKSEHQLLIRQLETIADLSETSRVALAALPMRIVNVASGQEIVREGDRPTQSCLVVSGIVCRFKMIGDGRRQILSFISPEIFLTCKAWSWRSWITAFWR